MDHVSDIKLLAPVHSERLDTGITVLSCILFLRVWVKDSERTRISSCLRMPETATFHIFERCSWLFLREMLRITVQYCRSAMTYE